MDKIFYEAVKITLNLVEKDCIIHFKTNPINAKVLDFHTYLEFRTFVLHKCVFFFKRQRLDLYFPKFRNVIQSTKGNIFASVAGTVMVGI